LRKSHDKKKTRSIGSGGSEHKKARPSSPARTARADKRAATGRATSRTAPRAVTTSSRPSRDSLAAAAKGHPAGHPAKAVPRPRPGTRLGGPPAKARHAKLPAKAVAKPSPATRPTAGAGKAGPVQRFARNAMCALVRPGLDVTSANLVERMLDPAIRLGTSTPVADPSGDYAWQLFERVERSGVPDASRRLAAKALQLTGGPASPPPPAGRNVYASLVAGGSADIFITYCTNAASAVREEPALRTVNMPDAIDVGASYGIASLAGESTGARAFVEFLLGQQGQRILAGHGFAPR